MKRLLLLCLLLLLVGCARQQTLFLSEPAGARVSIDGKVVGVTPCQFSYALGGRNERTLTLEKDGYAPLQVKVAADETNPTELKKWLAAGLVWSPLFVGTLFTNGMNDSYMMVLKQDPTRVAADTRPGTSGRD